MPDFWIHVLGGQSVLETLKNSDWKEMLEDNKKTYILGCQGPDFFFYNDFLPWIKTKRGPGIGTRIHQEHTKSLFLESINYLKESQNDRNFNSLASYFSGFIIHYVIDKQEHPFINARTNNSSEHKVFEAKLDTYFTKKYWNKKVHLLPQASEIDIGKQLPSVIVDFYRVILNRVYGISLDVATINDSYNDFKRVFNVFYSPTGGKRFGLNMLNILLPIDISIYSYPTEVDYEFLTENEFWEFEDLFKEGVAEGVQLIELVSSYLKGEIERSQIEKAFYDISFLGLSKE